MDDNQSFSMNVKNRKCGTVCRYDDERKHVAKVVNNSEQT